MWVAKLPVPLRSCFRREPEDAVCGRNSGLTDGRPAARDWKVSSGLGLATAARLGGPGAEGAPCRLRGSRAELAPKGHKEAAPTRAPPPPASGGLRATGPQPGASCPIPLAIWGALLRFLGSFLREGARKHDCPQKHGVSEPPERRLRTAPASRTFGPSSQAFVLAGRLARRAPPANHPQPPLPFPASTHPLGLQGGRLKDQGWTSPPAAPSGPCVGSECW